MRKILLFAFTLLLLLTAVLMPGVMPATAQRCDPTNYINQVLRDVNTADQTLSRVRTATDAANAYIQVAAFRRSYEDMSQIPDCALVLHSLIVQWFASAQDEAALDLAIVADQANAAKYQQEREAVYGRLTELSNAILNEIDRLQGRSITPTTPARTPTPAPTISAADWYRLYFTQAINSNTPAAHTGAFIERSLIYMIDNAQRTIDAALFEIDAPDTTAALIRAIRRGVKVRLVIDDEHALNDPGSTVQQIIDAGAMYRADNRSALMHNKYFIFDGATVWTGATNITRNGIYNNNNNAILIRSPQLAANYQNDFNKMFQDGNFTARRDVQNRPLTISGTTIESYFSPGDGRAIETRLVELINGARSSIRVMAFSFTLEPLGQAMINRMKAGVRVEGLFETTGSLRGQMTPLGCAGAAVRQDGNPSIMHHKVIIIDDRIVVFGSFNFSSNAISNNSENLLIINNADIATAFNTEFRARFNEGRAPSLRCN